MELYLMHNDPIQTVFATADGGPLYAADTPGRPAGSTTVLRRFEQRGSGHVESEIARVEYRGACGTTLSLWAGPLDLTLRPQAGGELTKWEFTGPDKRAYRWQIFIHYPVLTLNDNSQTPLARYRRAKLGIVSRSRRAFLEILPAGLNIIDWIVVTFVSFMRQRMTAQPEPECPTPPEGKTT